MKPESFPLGVYEYRFSGAGPEERVFARDLDEALVIIANEMDDDAPLDFVRRIGTFDVITCSFTPEVEP